MTVMHARAMSEITACCELFTSSGQDTRHACPACPARFYGLITPGHLISRSRYATRNMHRSVETRQRKPDWVMNIQATQWWMLADLGPAS